LPGLRKKTVREAKPVVVVEQAKQHADGARTHLPDGDRLRQVEGVVRRADRLVAELVGQVARRVPEAGRESEQALRWLDDAPLQGVSFAAT